jgi:hypothetical protein
MILLRQKKQKLVASVEKKLTIERLTVLQPMKLWPQIALHGPR